MFDGLTTQGGRRRQRHWRDTTNHRPFLFVWCCCLQLILSQPVQAYGIWQKIQKDYGALTRRVTARHILLPPNADELALTLKQKIRSTCTPPPKSSSSTNSIDHRTEEPPSLPFVVDVFADAARKYSRDDSTLEQGGLLCDQVPPGFVCPLCPELDRACFEVRLGIIEGPIASSYGTHLLLVTERTQCPALDGPYTKLVPGPRGGLGELVVASAPETTTPSSTMDSKAGQVVRDVLTQVVFWVFVLVSGGLVAEVAAQVGSWVP